MRNDINFEPWKISAQNVSLNDDYIESVFFIGNGRMGSRGYSSLEHNSPPNKTGLFVAGVYGELKKGITDFVNLPTPFFFNVKVNETSIKSEPQNISYSLDLHSGLETLKYELSFENIDLSVKEERFFSLCNPALAFERITLLVSDNADVEILSGIKTDCCNLPINDDQTKKNNETVSLISAKKTSFKDKTAKLQFETNGTGIKLSETVTLKLVNAEIVENCDKKNFSGFRIHSKASKYHPIIIEKNIVIKTSRDIDPNLSDIKKNGNFDSFYFDNCAAWQKRWETANIELYGNAKADSALRYVVFQLIVNDSAYDPTVSIGARGLTHTRYKGCYFWDTDLFMMPFYLYTLPEGAKNLMQYRAATLPQAKEHAKKMNNAGARYPWMTSFDGTEQCESWDIGASEVHITADVVFALNNYITATGDSGFYKNKAAEIYIETARFWLSRYSKEEGTGRVNLLFCKGPDEYCGITENNLYTNVMVKENLSLAVAAAEFLKKNDIEKYNSLKLTDDEVKQFTLLKNAIKLPKDPETGHYKQDDTFSLLEKVEKADIKKLKKGDTASYHKVCFDRVQRYRVIKQADVILLMTRFKDMFTKEEKAAAWQDFEPICLHDSTLSFATHALFAAQNGINEAAEYYFNKALFLDLCDLMQNTGTEGLHMACFGETWQSVIFGFAGLSFKDGKPILNPHLPPSINGIKFNFYYLGKRYKAEIKKDGFTLELLK